jgi:flagellar hook assembly protein FlgD
VPAAPIPYRFALEQNYPNPYNATTTILYSCGQDGFVSLKVYNILGQEVATLVGEHKSAGSYTVSWDSQDRYGNPLASGIYFYRVIAGQFVASKKLVLIR